MKQNIKNLILIFLGLIIIVILAYVIFFSEKSKPTNQQTSENSVTSTASLASSTPVIDPAIMTQEERRALRVDPTLKIEVLRRSATGTPTDYRIIK